MANTVPLDCACVIHGDFYQWIYVETLHSMLSHNFQCPIRLHVFTEQSRPVPDHMIKHELTDWPGVSGRKRAWWYKMQIFDPRQGFSGPVLYLDLDVAITGSMDWILALDKRFFWAVRDFRYLWRPTWRGINSSMMFWDASRYPHIWRGFQARDLTTTIRQFSGDQDYLTEAVDQKDCRFFDQNMVRSWRWEIKDGGLDVRTREYRRPGTGTNLNTDTKIMIFHGNPKPHEIVDPVINRYWNTQLA